MKAIIGALLVLALATSAFGQAAPPQSAQMYDQSYQGPMNVYGQPVFSMGPQAPTDPGQQNQQASGGVVGTAFDGLGSIGNYFWSFMPAPVRGVQSPYQVPPGAGQVTVTYSPVIP